jgi:hypothetical protein
MVNMVKIRQLLSDSLYDVLEESPCDSSEGLTKTTSTCPTFPLGFRGMIFHVSHDSATRDGENSDERDAHLAKNADRQHRKTQRRPMGPMNMAHHAAAIT